MPTTNIITNLAQLDMATYNVLQASRLNPYYKDTVACGFGKNMWSSFMDIWADNDFICSPTWRRVEEQYDCKTLTVNAATIIPTGTTLTITSPYKASDAYTNIQPGWGLYVPSIGKNLYVESVATTPAGAFTMVVRPRDGSYSGGIGGGATLLVQPLNLRNEGACNIGNSSSAVPGIERTYSMGIYSRIYRVTRTAAQSFCKDMYIFKDVRVTNDGCEEFDTLWHADLQNMYEEFYYGIEAERLLGEGITNGNVSITRAMTGLMPQLRTKAQTMNYDIAGYSVSNIDTATKNIKKKRGYCNEYFLYGGMNWRSQIDTALKADFLNGAVSYGAFEGLFDYNSAPGALEGQTGGGKQRAISYGFTSVQRNGVTLHLHDLDAFNDECFGGATGFDYPNTYFGMPACKLLCNGNMSKSIRLTYLQDNGTGLGSSSFIMRDRGILREDNWQGCDYHEWEVLSEEGLEVVCADRWIIGTGA